MAGGRPRLQGQEQQRFHLANVVLHVPDQICKKYNLNLQLPPGLANFRSHNGRSGRRRRQRHHRRKRRRQRQRQQRCRQGLMAMLPVRRGARQQPLLLLERPDRAVQVIPKLGHNGWRRRLQKRPQEARVGRQRAPEPVEHQCHRDEPRPDPQDVPEQEGQPRASTTASRHWIGVPAIIPRRRWGGQERWPRR